MVIEAVLWGALLLLLWLSLRKPRDLPPGRWGLPLVGFVPLTRRSVGQQLVDLRAQHGDVYLWRMGTQLMVFLHDHKLVKETFNRPEFQERPAWGSFTFMEQDNVGVIASVGSVWHNNRRFVLRQLRDLGMGKTRLVSAVQAQAEMLVREMGRQAGGAAPLPLALKVAVINVVWQMVGGKQFSVTDPKFKHFEELLDSIMNSFEIVVIPDFMPWINSLVPAALRRRIFKQDQLIKVKDALLGFMEESIEEHKATLDRQHPRDLIDSYLIDMEEKKHDPTSTRSEKDLSFLMMDLFTAGSETTASTLVWLFHYLATHPPAQDKMRAEVDSVLPRGTMATLEHKPRLPYCEAVIHETLRKSSLSSYGVFHVTREDTTLGPYFLPKGTLVNSANISIHHSDRYWDRPHLFLPERWLDAGGKFDSKKEGFLPFSTGKRQCAGEALARMELFIFSTAVVQNFKLGVPPGKTLLLEPQPGNPFFRRPLIQDLLVTARA